MEPLKEFSKTVLTLDNCIIPRERLFNTPSSKDGMDHSTEVDVRIKGCECIQAAGVLLKLPQAAMATAQIIFQRYFYAKSLVKFNFYYAAMASLFLAAKIEECNRRLRDILNVFHHLKQKRKGSHIWPSLGMAEVWWQPLHTVVIWRPCFGLVHELLRDQCKLVPMDYVGEEYYGMRNTVNKYERYILKELGFCVHVQHPHKLVITCLQLLELEQNASLVQKAWNFMNDALKTNIFVRFEVQTVACACIFLAARQLKIPLPENPPWWRLFDVRFKDMKAISLELLALYQRQPRSLEELEKEVDTLKKNLMSQKNVVKEINVKKKMTLDNSSPSQSISPSDQSSSLLTVSNKTSPASKPGVSPLIETSHRESTQQDKPTKQSPVNSYKRDRGGSASPCVVDKRPKLMTNTDSSEPAPHMHTHQRTPEAYRPILSPIKISSDSHTDDDSMSPPSQPNGYTQHYSTERELGEETEVSRSRKHHHKHRSSEKHRHHRRDRSRSRERSRDRKHSRHHHREEDRYSQDISRIASLTSRSHDKDYTRLRKSDSYYR